MDVVHHACIGGVGMLALGEQGQELAGLGFLAGSVFPDLDVAFMAAGKRFYLKRHQGPTHSLVLAPLYAAALAAIVVPGIGWQWTLYLGLLAGLAIHVALDLTNTFGIQMLWPLTGQRYCADAIFFVDLTAWLLTLGFFAVVVTGGVAATPAALGYAALFAAYVAFKLALHRSTMRRTGAAVAIPSSWNPFAFFLLRRGGTGVETSRYDAIRAATCDVRLVEAPSEEIRGLASRSPVFNDMAGILRALHVTDVVRDPEGTTLVAHDLAIRNFGGRFGRTELRFDHGGRIVREVANI